MGSVTHVQGVVRGEVMRRDTELHSQHVRDQESSPPLSDFSFTDINLSTSKAFETPRFWVNRSAGVLGANPSRVLHTCPGDLDGDLLLEPPHQDRIADVPMVQMTSQSITVGIAPEVSGNYQHAQQSDLSARLELKDSFNMQFSGLLSVEGGLNLNFGLDSLLSRGSDGTQHGMTRKGSRKNSLGLNARNALEYSLASEMQRQRAAAALEKASASSDVTITANAGVISLQFTISNSGSQAVVLSEPSFAVLSQLRDANGHARTVTVVPEQGIASQHAGDPWLRQQGMVLTLGPGESRTIALRLEGQSTSMIMELMRKSRATWATLNFGKQTALTDPRLHDEGAMIPGTERDMSRDLVSRIRKRTIPFLFAPPVQGPFGKARTSLLAAVPPGVLENDGSVACWHDQGQNPYLGATLSDLFRYHGNIDTTWEQAHEVTTDDGSVLVLPRVGPTLSSLSATVSQDTLMALSHEERRQRGRWELQVYHRDYGVVSAQAMMGMRLTPDHIVHLRWVDGQTLLERSLPDLIHRGQARTDAAKPHVEVRPGDTVNVTLRRLRFARPFIEEHRANMWKRGEGFYHLFQPRVRGTHYAYDQLPHMLRDRMQVRYAYVHPGQEHYSQIEWKRASVSRDGAMTIKVPHGLEVPEGAKLVVQALPIVTQRREGVFVGDAREAHSPLMLFGRRVHEEYPVALDYDFEIMPGTSSAPHAGSAIHQS